MKLTAFITSLLHEGNVTVDGQLTEISANDREHAVREIENFYRRDILEIAGTAPLFNKEAALFGAEFLYFAIQLTINREADEASIQSWLKPYETQISPSVIYSADLILRNLPAIFVLAKGLAPADVLMIYLKNMAANWPFSSVGISLEQPVDDEIIFCDPVLRLTYLDRIVHRQDRKRITAVNEHHLLGYTGNNLHFFWPDFEISHTLQV